jgi:hypothetical protein
MKLTLKNKATPKAEKIVEYPVDGIEDICLS